MVYLVTGSIYIAYILNMHIFSDGCFCFLAIIQLFTVHPPPESWHTASPGKYENMNEYS